MTAESRSTRIALAGFGAWGQMHAKAIGAIEEAAISAVYCHGDRSEQAAKEQFPDLPRYRDYDRMLAEADYDVVTVAVPNFQHAKFAIAALEAGSDVFLEKPLGVTIDECDAVIAATRRTGKLVAVNHELRVSRQWKAVRDAVAAGDLGAVRFQHFSLFRHGFRLGSGGWRHDNERVGSWTLEELVHFFDLVLWYGSDNGLPTHVRASGNGGTELFQNFTAELVWADGSTAMLTQCLSGFEHHTALEVAGDAGAIRTWWSGAQDRTMTPDFELKIKRRGQDSVEILEIPFSGEVFELEENIRAALKGFRRGESILPPEAARASVAVCLAAEEAARSRQTVALDFGV
jgi:myo-inositol 2-dehydrogenase/D-chiro-inositol 1-dehydrogenase